MTVGSEGTVGQSDETEQFVHQHYFLNKKCTILTCLILKKSVIVFLFHKHFYFQIIFA